MLKTIYQPRNSSYFEAMTHDTIKMDDLLGACCIIVDDSTQTPFLIKLSRLEGCENASTVQNQPSRNPSLRNLSEENSTIHNPLDLEAKKCLSKLYSIRNSDAEALGFAFEIIESAFSKHELSFVNALLANFDPNQTKPIISTGLLRSTSRAKAKLGSWKVCAARVNECLSLRGENTKHILRGIIRNDDPIILSTTAIS